MIDLDGPVARDEWRTLVRKYGAPETMWSRTGRATCGAHLWYLAPEGVRLPSAKLGEALETRGHGGYIVAPPSVHPETGRRYELHQAA